MSEMNPEGRYRLFGVHYMLTFQHYRKNNDIRSALFLYL